MSTGKFRTAFVQGVGMIELLFVIPVFVSFYFIQTICNPLNEMFISLHYMYTPACTPMLGHLRACVRACALSFVIALRTFTPYATLLQLLGLRTLCHSQL